MSASACEQTSRIEQNSSYCDFYRSCIFIRWLLANSSSLCQSDKGSLCMHAVEPSERDTRAAAPCMYAVFVAGASVHGRAIPCNRRTPDYDYASLDLFARIELLRSIHPFTLATTTCNTYLPPIEFCEFLRVLSNSSSSSLVLEYIRRAIESLLV